MRSLTHKYAQYIGLIISYTFLISGAASWIMTLVNNNLSLNEFNILLVFIGIGAANFRILFRRVPIYVEILLEILIVIFLFAIAYEFQSPMALLANIIFSMFLLMSYVEL